MKDIKDRFEKGYTGSKEDVQKQMYSDIKELLDRFAKMEKIMFKIER